MLAVFPLLLLISILFAPPAQAQGWKTFPNPGLDFQIFQAAIDGGDVYAGGYVWLSHSGQVHGRVERWDGQRWNVLMDSALGVIRALRILGGKPYIAFDDGRLREAEDKRHSVIRVWDGKAWSTIAASPLDNEEIVDFIPMGDKLVAAAGRGVWSWDGKAWTAFGDPGFYPSLLLAHGDTVYAGGQYPGDNGKCLARYVSGTWTAMNLAENAHVYALAWWDGKLAVGGGVWKGNEGMDTGTGLLGKWNGSALQEMPLPVERKFARVEALDTCEGSLYVSLKARSNGWALPSALFRANSGGLAEVTGWRGGDAVNTGTSFAALASQGGKLVVAGGFAGKDGKRIQNIALHENGEWRALGGDPAAAGPSAATLLAPYPGGMCALGRQTFAGAGVSEGFDCWDGKTWTPLAGWKNRTTRDSYPVLPDYSDFRWDGTRLLIAGDFDSLGNQAIKRLAYRDGDAWKPLGAGLSDPVATTGSWRDTLVVATYSHPDSATWLHTLRKWDGSAWGTIALPEGFGKSAISGLAEYGGELWMAGSSNGKLFISAWEGKDWRDALGPAAAGKPAGQFQGMQTAGGRLYIHTRDDTASAFHQWDGKAWSEIGRANYSWCHMLASTTHLYVSGDFSRIGGKAIDWLAKWDGAAWSKVGAGLGFQSCHAAAWGQDRLFVYGNYFDEQGRYGEGLTIWDTRADIVGLRSPRGKSPASRWRIMTGGTLVSPVGEGHRIDGRRRAGFNRKGK